MGVILFTGDAESEAGTRLREAVQSVAAPHALELVHTFADLSRRLGRSPRMIHVAVLHAHGEEALSEMVLLRELLEGVNVILVLAHRESETLSRGYRLKPRFIAFADEDFGTLKAVLQKMMSACWDLHLAPHGDQMQQ